MMSQETQALRYEGFDDLNREDGQPPRYQPPICGSEPDVDGRKYYPYFPTLALQEAVNLSIALKRPLLLEGEPGCGKTRLAEAIAYEFAHKYLKGEDQQRGWFFKEWNVKSVGRARDGLYTFDAVARLRDAQLVGAGVDQIKALFDDGKESPESPEFTALKERLRNKGRYVEFGALGAALSQDGVDRPIVERPIVLIDEIDKADSDFPNDMLRELDRLEFTVTETGDKYPKSGMMIKPIVIITSNRERPLPEAFLRRCLYFKLDFPDEIQLAKIICGRFPEIQADLLEKVIGHFLEVRESFQDVPGSKPPGTSEILDFLTVLDAKPIKDAMMDLDSLAEPSKSHLLGILLKTDRDQTLYRDNFPAMGDY
jgi:MoxR-like ATPase